jgi:hypothetical protein
MSFPSKKRSHSTGRSDLSTNEKQFNDIYQPSFNTIGLFPTINQATLANKNYNSSTKNNFRPKFLQYIEENIIGKDYIFQGPWGLRRSMIYHIISYPFFFVSKCSTVIIQHQVDRYNLLKIILELMSFLCKKICKQKTIYCNRSIFL